MARRGFVRALLPALIILGLCCAAWPLVSDQISLARAAEAVAAYRREVQALSDAEREAALERARALPDGTPGADALPSFGGVIAVLEIPRLGVLVPICLEDAWPALGCGAAHAMGGSLPVGGEGAHLALVGLCDIGGERPFAALGRMLPGDVFFIEVLGEKMAYAVERETSVEAAGSVSFEREEGRDLCTLMTAPTNTGGERVLVRGVRTSARLTAAVDGARVLPSWLGALVFALPALAAGTAFLLAAWIIARRRKKRRFRRLRL